MKSLKLSTVGKYQLLLILVGIIFLAQYAWFYAATGPVFSSPDENANFVFTNEFRQHNDLGIDEPANQLAPGLAHPRSTIVIDNEVLPGSFVGLPVLLGIVSKALGGWSILFITPVLVIVAVQFLFRIYIRIFSKKIAFFASLLSYVCAPLWYFSSRSMFHNMLFLSLLVIAIAALVLARNMQPRVRYLTMVGVGVLTSLSLFVRLSETIWVLFIILAVLLLLYPARKYYRLYLAVLLGLCIGFAPLMIANDATYGSPFTFSYTVAKDTVTANAGEGGASHWLSGVTKYIFPFGIHLHQSWVAARTYLIGFFPWYSIFVIFGVLTYIKRLLWGYLHRWGLISAKQESVSAAERIYLFLFCCIVAWLILYYGAYSFSEHDDPEVLLVGSSYIRYWLPLFLFGVPFWITGVYAITRKLFSRQIGTIAFYAAVALFVIASVHSVLFDKTQGLVAIQQNVEEYRQYQATLRDVVHRPAIVIAGSSDKFIYPDISVLATPDLQRTSHVVALRTLSQKYSVYYLLHPGESFETLQQQYNQFSFSLGTPLTLGSNLTVVEISTQ